MTPTRHQRRARERQRKQFHATLFREGLPAGDDPFPMMVLAHYLVGILGKSDGVTRASEAAAAAQRVFETSMKNHPPEQQLACQKGCSYCCHTNAVGATIPEILLLAKTIRVSGDNVARATKDKVRETNSITKGMDLFRRIELKSPCPLLVDNICSQYETRPLACRGYTSFSLAACEESFGNPLTEIPPSRVYVHFRSKCSVALWAALKAVGLPYRCYELNEALDIALETHDAEARWLLGEDMFSGVQVDETSEPHAEKLVEELIDGAMN